MKHRLSSQSRIKFESFQTLDGSDKVRSNSLCVETRTPHTNSHSLSSAKLLSIFRQNNIQIEKLFVRKEPPRNCVSDLFVEIQRLRQVSDVDLSSKAQTEF